MKYLYTRPQLLRVLAGWGYTEVPTVHDRSHLVLIPPTLRDTGHSHAKVSFGPVNGQRVRLYEVEFVHMEAR
jgi:hypothetical protein